jgi:hypothetical protein
VAEGLVGLSRATQEPEPLLDRTLVLTKTEKGLEALQRRSDGLPQRLRTILVLVDGRQSVDRLIARFGALDGMEPALQQLLEQGFIATGNPRD